MDRLASVERANHERVPYFEALPVGSEWISGDGSHTEIGKIGNDGSQKQLIRLCKDESEKLLIIKTIFHRKISRKA